MLLDEVVVAVMLSNVNLALSDIRYYPIAGTKRYPVLSRGVPNFGSELGLGRVSYHSAKTRTYNASEYLKKQCR